MVMQAGLSMSFYTDVHRQSHFSASKPRLFFQRLFNESVRAAYDLEGKEGKEGQEIQHN